MNKKTKGLQIARRISQIFFFLLFPGMFATIFYSLKTIITGITNHTSFDSNMVSALLIFFGVVLLTALFGRFFCGFMCSFGAMGDFLWFLSEKIHKKKHRLSDTVNNGLSFIKYILLAFIIFGGWILQIITIPQYWNPWTIFGLYTNYTNLASPNHLLSIGALLLILIMIASLFVERFFCRYLCPLGGIFSLVSHFRIFNIRKPHDKCGNCRLCSHECSMGISLGKYDKVTSVECINCFQCVNVCPKKNASANPNPFIISAISVASITGLVYAGSLVTESPAIDSSTVTTSSQTVAQGTYTDGTYTGTGTGFRGNTTVSVTVENGNITDITIDSFEDDTDYFNRAKNTIINEILKAQDVDVDTVSSATFSSNGIKEAVANALSLSFTNPNNSTFSNNRH